MISRPRLLVAVVAGALACGDHPLPLDPTVPAFEIVDAARDDAMAHFYFLVPMVWDEPTPTGTFDAALLPHVVVTVCELGPSGCGLEVERFTADGSFFKRVTASQFVLGGHVFEQYVALWRTDGPGVSVEKVYRTTVTAAGVTLGYADVKLVRTKQQAAAVDRSQYALWVKGLPLPIRFRIEEGIVGQVTVEPVEASVGPNETQQFIALLTDLHGQATDGDVTWSSSDESVAMVDQSGLATAIGDGVAAITATSQRVSGSATLTVVGGVVMASAGGSHSCALSAEARSYCWGMGTQGQLGDGAMLNRFTPVAVAGDLTFTTIEAGSSHTCAVTDAGDAYCWGSNTFGQLGDGSNANRLTPAAVVDDLTFVAISAGLFHSCAITETNHAYCWGEGAQGRVGNGMFGRWPTPQPVSGNHPFASISAGATHSCGVTTDGLGYCWGFNSSGQLGDGTVVTRLSPVPVDVDRTFLSIEAGTNFTCGLTTEGEAYCWGLGSFGRLGNGSLDNQASPVAVAGTWEFASIGAGFSHACGLTALGQALCWGAGTNGKLGHGSTANAPTPVAVMGDLTFASIAVGGDVTCGVTTGGKAYCWGSGLFGQVGNGLRPFAQTTPAEVAPLP